MAGCTASDRWWRSVGADASTRTLPAFSAEPPPVTPAGRVVAGRYRLRRLLGHGGMGAVWLAHDETLHRPVAIKQVLLTGLETGEERSTARARLLREARLAARVNHPGTVQVYDLVEEAGHPWIVMEALPGRTLEAALRALRAIQRHGASRRPAPAASPWPWVRSSRHSEPLRSTCG